jgi:hypothetical protein
MSRQTPRSLIFAPRSQAACRVLIGGTCGTPCGADLALWSFHFQGSYWVWDCTAWLLIYRLAPDACESTLDEVDEESSGDCDSFARSGAGGLGVEMGACLMGLRFERRTRKQIRGVRVPNTGAGAR